MEKYLSLFPLNLVVYPGKDLNLHIFEERYRQLINECLDTEETFGIPAFINNKMPGYGTEMRITTLHKRYEDGRMDIKTQGLGIFRLVNYENPAPGKLFAAGNVETIDTPAEHGSFKNELRSQVLRLYELLKIDVTIDFELPLLSYQIAHKIGLSVEEEYKLLTIVTEDERQQFLLRHLKRVMPVLSEMERTKDRIQMNGHFKNLIPPNF